MANINARVIVDVSAEFKVDVISHPSCFRAIRQSQASIVLRHSQRRGHSQRQSQGHALAFKRRCERHGHGHTSASAFTAPSSSETKLSVARPSQRRSLTAMRRRQSPTSDFVLSRHASRPDVNADVRGACLYALVGTALLSVKAQCVVCSGLSNS